MKKTVFINSTLAPLMAQRFNEELVKIVKKEGFEVHLPQRVMPPNTSIPAIRIMKENIKAIEKCDVMLSVLDHVGLGVAFEIGYAIAKNKVLIAFRTDFQNYLGKILEGFWDSLEPEKKAQDFDELRRVLRNLHS